MSPSGIQLRWVILSSKIFAISIDAAGSLDGFFERFGGYPIMTFFKNFKGKVQAIAAAPQLTGDAIRFIFAGLLNTGITIIIYELGLIFFEYRIAYSISWLVGIVIAIVFYPSKVFVGGRTSLISRLLIVIVYVVVFFSGLFALEQLKNCGVPANACIFFVIILTTVVNFLLMRLVLRARV